MRSWKKHHPSSRGWRIHLWTEDDIIDDADRRVDNHDEKKETKQTPAFHLGIGEMHNARGYRRASKIGNYGMASDILRLEILNKFGGVYVDVDYWCVDPLDDVVAAREDGRPVQLFCGASNAGCVELNNGLLACRRGGHPVLWEMMDSIRSYFDAPSSNRDRTASLLSSFLDPAAASALEAARRVGRDVSPEEVVENTGPGLLTRALCRWLVGGGAGDRPSDRGRRDSAWEVVAFDPSRVAVFPSRAFHPFPNRLRGELPSSGDAPTGEDRLATGRRGGGVATDDGGRQPSGVGPSPSRSMLRAFVVPGETKAIHLWGCSWQRR